VKLRLAAFLAGCCLFAQVAQKANEHYQTPEDRAGMAAALTSKDREAKQKPQAVVAMLGIKPGMTVADVGAGAGYMLPYLSAAVGPAGKLIAEDIFPDFLDRARNLAADHQLNNVSFVLGTEKDARLGSGIDLALLMDVYHHLNYPADSLASLRRSLKTDGRLAVVEYHRSPEAMNGNAMQHIRLDADDAIKEIEANGFRLMSRSEHKPAQQWVAIFALK
jgi:ubiquinone/menaquinone biosynthesis C-methylase UbiE